MGEESLGPYTKGDFWRAVLLASFLAWAVIVGYMVLPRRDFGMIGMMAVFGLPVSFLVTLVFGGPILTRMMRHSVGWTRAAVGGGLSATLMATVAIIFGRVQGYQESIDPTSYSEIGGGEFVRSVDGILTPYGWQVLAQNTALFIALGIVVGLVVRWIIGPGRPQVSSDDVFG